MFVPFLMTSQFPFEIFCPLQPNDETTEEEAVEMSDLEKAKKLLQPMAGQPCLLRYLKVFLTAVHSSLEG